MDPFRSPVDPFRSPVDPLRSPVDPLAVLNEKQKIKDPQIKGPRLRASGNGNGPLKLRAPDYLPQVTSLN